MNRALIQNEIRSRPCCAPRCIHLVIQAIRDLLRVLQPILGESARSACMEKT